MCLGHKITQCRSSLCTSFLSRMPATFLLTVSAFPNYNYCLSSPVRLPKNLFVFLFLSTVSYQFLRISQFPERKSDLQNISSSLCCFIYILALEALVASSIHKCFKTNFLKQILCGFTNYSWQVCHR